jgi:hypothetical protein
MRECLAGCVKTARIRSFQFDRESAVVLQGNGRRDAKGISSLKYRCHSAFMGSFPIGRGRRQLALYI